MIDIHDHISATYESAEDKAKQRAYADQLRDQLAGITVEKPSNAAIDAVPAAAIVGGTVGKQSHGDHAPQPAGSVDRNSAHGIVHPDDPVDELDAQADQYAGDQADDGGSDRAYNPLGAVIATSPANRPLPDIEASGFP